MELVQPGSDITQYIDGVEGLLTDIKSNQTNGNQITQITGTVPLPTGASTSAKQDINTATIQDLYNQLCLTIDRLEYGIVTDNAKRLKVTLIDSGALGSVGTVSSVTNTVRQGDLQIGRVNEAILDMAFINGITNNVAFT